MACIDMNKFRRIFLKLFNSEMFADSCGWIVGVWMGTFVRFVLDNGTATATLETIQNIAHYCAVLCGSQ